MTMNLYYVTYKCSMCEYIHAANGPENKTAPNHNSACVCVRARRRVQQQILRIRRLSAHVVGAIL